MSSNRENSEDQAVSRILGSLARVEAPGDFEIGVRRRIANGKPSASGARKLLLAGAAAAVIVIPAVPAYYVLYGGTEEQAAIPVVNESPQTAADPPSVPGPVTSDAPSTTAPQQQIAASSSADPPRTEPGDRTSRDLIAAAATPIVARTGGDPQNTSIDRSISPVMEPILPKGLSVPSGNNSGAGDNGLKVPIRDVLQMIGIEAQLIRGTWIAKSVRANSLAARSGVRVNDSIISIDGKALDANSTFNAAATGKTLTIRRGSETRTLQIR